MKTFAEMTVGSRQAGIEKKHKFGRAAVFTTLISDLEAKSREWKMSKDDDKSKCDAKKACGTEIETMINQFREQIK